MVGTVITTLLVLISAPAWGQTFMEDFNAGIPGTWAVVDNIVDGPVWDTNAFWGDDNWTGGDGMCADVNSDTFGGGDFDTELITHDFVVLAGAVLEYDTNYQNFNGDDFADVDINVGAGWVNLHQWNEDHGGFKALPGEHVVIDLAPYLGETATIRFHYWDPGPDDWNWYWEVDNVEVRIGSPVEETTWGSIKSMFR